MLTGSQIRAARHALQWTLADLELKSGVNRRTIIRLESVDGLPSANTGTLSKISKALESAGIEFIERADGARGIFMRPSSGE